MDEEKLYQAMCLQSISGQLIERRKNDKKPIFPFSRSGSEIKIEAVKPKRVFKNQAMINTYEEGTYVISEIIKNTNNSNCYSGMKKISTIWNHFFSAHHQDWNTNEYEYIIANIWLNWINDYNICFLGGNSNNWSFLDCNVIPIEMYNNTEMVSMKPLIDKLSGFEARIDSVIQRIKGVSEKEIIRISERFIFPKSERKIYLTP